MNMVVELVTVSCLGLVVAKQAQFVTPPPPCSTVGVRGLWRYGIGLLVIWNVCGSFRFHFASLSCAFMFFNRIKGPAMVSNPPHWGIITFKLFGDDLITLSISMSISYCFSEVMANVLSSGHDVDSKLPESVFSKKGSHTS